MAAPKLPVTIGLKVPIANVGEFVIIRNLTRGGQLTGQVRGTDRSAVFNPAPTTQWENGDLIQAEVRGRIAVAKQETVRVRKVDFDKLNAVADTTTPGINL